MRTDLGESSLLVKRDTTRESSLESFGVGSSIVSHVGNRVEARLVGACEAIRPTDRLTEMRAAKNPVCNTPKASSVNAGRIERASQKVERRSRTSRSWLEGVPVDMAAGQAG